MRYSKSFIPTLKEAPKDAVMPSHRLLLRGGYVRMIGAGIYEMLPLGLRVLNKIAAIVRDEMGRAEAQELLLPTLLPREYFEQSGRWESFGPALIRLKDRRGADYNLGPTHEEIITDLIRREIKSYKQLPLSLFQVQMKFRDEPRPRAGLLRCREFLMKDAYSFDVSEEAAQTSYDTMKAAYHRIFKRLGLDYRIVGADSGAMGGSTSAEFQVLAENGEDSLVACTSCDYAANLEVAAVVVSEREPVAADTLLDKEELSTPGVKTIKKLVEFVGEGLDSTGTLKSLVYLAEGELVMAVVRGDHEINEIKLARALGVAEVFLATDKDVNKATGSWPGSIGPVGFAGKLLVDHAASAVLNGVCGANVPKMHLKNVNYGRDFEGQICDLRSVGEGDRCPECGEGLQLLRGIEGGHIFILGTHYSAKMNATFLDEDGKSQPVVMGCYGIGVSRLLATAIEQNHDDNGIKWPAALAPYTLILSPIGKDAEPFELAESLYKELLAMGVEVLLDDRRERPGVKFKDADLLGIPLRVTIGNRGLKNGELELKVRGESDSSMIPVEGAAAHLKGLVEQALSATGQ